MSTLLAQSPSPQSAAKRLGRGLVDGKWIDSISRETFPVMDPATGEKIADVSAGDAADVDLAVKAARRAFEDNRWRQIGPAERAKILWRVGALIDRDATELSHLETLNNGMPLPLAGYSVATAAEGFRYYAGWCSKTHGLTSDISGPAGNFHAYTLKEPVGVAGLITPWNAPLLLSSAKLAPALAAGCCCVLKPAEETPLTALRLGELLHEAGIPDGVVNIVPGLGHIAGSALVNHPHVDKVSFTGSTEVGKIIVTAAAGNLKRVSLELGGKSPVIVFKDADLDAAVAGVALGAFANAGQVCVAGSRVYVHRCIIEGFLRALSSVAAKMKIGSGFDADTEVGPLISARQLARVIELVDGSRAQGSEVVTGGTRHRDTGFFMQPTVLAKSRADSRVMVEEIFGPVVNVVAFDEIEDVICAANATDFGLAAAVWTRDISIAHRVAKRLSAGTVWLNCQLTADLSMPFGGYKQSGWGRESGLEGLESFMQTKSVFAQL